MKKTSAPALFSTSVTNKDFLRSIGLSEGVFENSFALVRGKNVCALVPRMELTGLPKKVHATGYSNADEKRAGLKQILRGIREVAVDSTKITLADKQLLEGVKLVDGSARLRLQRAIKNAKEIRAIRKANAVTQRALRQALATLRTGVSEKEVARIVDLFFFENGAKPAFETIVAFGENSTNPHHVPSKRRLHSGEFVLIDCGAKLGGYCADLTRTIVFGRARAKQKEIIKVCKQALQLALKEIRPGAKAKEVAERVNAFISGAGYGNAILHSLGHSLGMEVHDGLTLSVRADFAFRKGMVFAVEPGIYVKGLGGTRLEEDVIVTRKGCKVI